MIMCSISVLFLSPIPIESAHVLEVAYSHSDTSWWTIDISIALSSIQRNMWDVYSMSIVEIAIA